MDKLAAQAARGGPQGSSAARMLTAYGYMALWIACSAGVIMLNKYILDPGLGGFPFPLTLTAIHMAFCSSVAWLLVKARVVEAPPMPTATYVRCVLPIGALFAVTLWMGNAAYIYLSVSFVQMLKASMPMLVYAVGTAMGTERWCARTGANLAVVVAGVVTASYGELVFVALGVVFQVASMACEAVRLTLVQVLLQRRGIRLNPITTMYHVSPVCLACLVLPFALLEAERVLLHEWRVGAALLAGSAAAAFALNCTIFLLIGKTSALTMNVAGVAKDVLLIALSMACFGSMVTELQLIGYAVALCGAFVYNLRRTRAAAAAAAAAAAKAAASSDGGACGRAGAPLAGRSSSGQQQDFLIAAVPGGGGGSSSGGSGGGHEAQPLLPGGSSGAQQRPASSPQQV